MNNTIFWNNFDENMVEIKAIRQLQESGFKIPTSALAPFKEFLESMDLLCCTMLKCNTYNENVFVRHLQILNMLNYFN